MRTFFNYIFISFLALLSLSSCRDEIILDLNTIGAIPVIEANISNDSVPFRVRVTTTTDYYSLNIPFVSSALVLISGSDGTNDTLAYDTAGYYVSKSIHPCKVGETYTLTVSYDGKTYTASEMCRPQNPVDSVKTIFTPKRGFLPEGYYLWEWTTERPGLGDHYLWNIYRNDTLLNDDFYLINDDEIVDGQEFAFDFFFKFNKNDSILFEQQSISKNLYNFLNNVQNQGNRDGSPFSAPPSNIAGNISNNALGFFSVRNIIRRKLVAQ